MLLTDRSIFLDAGARFFVENKLLTIRVATAVGSYGFINLVQHSQTSKLYALKVLEKSEVLRLNEATSVERERAILSSLDLPFVVKLCVSFLSLSPRKSNRFLFRTASNRCVASDECTCCSNTLAAAHCIST